MVMIIVENHLSDGVLGKKRGLIPIKRLRKILF